MQQLTSMLISILLVLVCHSYADPVLSGCQESSWYSEEEQFPVDDLAGYPLVGLSCQGDYCDQLQSQQCTMVVNDDDTTFDLHTIECQEMSWTFSEEDGSRNCNDTMFVESLGCEERYCDNIRLRCCTPTDWTVDYMYWEDTAWFSDPDSVTCPPMYVAIGAGCSGRYCDNMKLTCAPIVLNAEVKKSFGSWVSVCSSSNDNCQFAQKETVSLERKSVWDSKFSASVSISISAGINFLDAIVALDDKVLESMEHLVAIGHDIERSCSNELQIKPGNSELVRWQWVMDVEDISITDPAGTGNKLHMTTCFYFSTSALDIVPKCTPRHCADEDCQTCTE